MANRLVRRCACFRSPKIPDVGVVARAHCPAYRPAETIPMTPSFRTLLGASIFALAACQSDRVDKTSPQNRIATRPASMSSIKGDSMRLWVPQLGNAGVAANLRQSLSALPGVIQALPNLSDNEVVVRTDGSVTPGDLTQVLQGLGLQGMVR